MWIKLTTDLLQIYYRFITQISQLTTHILYLYQMLVMVMRALKNLTLLIIFKSITFLIEAVKSSNMHSVLNHN